jgi:para-aminobenzoate synthetase / 4-amino-4-deoxychorismate lyase
VSVRPAQWLAALEGRQPLVLAPSDERGWFSGRTLVAFDPIEVGGCRGVGVNALHDAGRILERAFHAETPLLAVALLPYSGDVRWAVYSSWLELARGRWVRRGAEPPRGWPEAPAPGGVHASAGSRETAAPATATATSLDAAAFCSAVEATRAAILDGDVYVLNLTRTVGATTSLAPPALFAALCERAPATMAAAWLADGAPALLSASPERFVRIAGHEIEIAPVKGTRPRGGTPAQDAALAEALDANEKEHAEHVMVVDLERNDLGRVCVPGSVRVDPLCAIESTAYCHQMVSSVRGLLRADATLGDVLEATFPCGSITGAPKVAAMRIAGQLEPTERGVYTGSLVVATPGEVDSAVLIRTAEQQGSDVRYGTGCGITVDSDAAEEWEESVLKISPLLGSAGGGDHVALKETCRAVGGRVPLWPWHRARLAGGGVSAEVLALADKRVAEAAAGWADAPTRRARLTLVIAPDGDVTADVAQRLSSLDVPNGPLATRVDVADLPPIPPLPAKPADRTWWDAAHARAEAVGAHQAVMVAPDGTIVDGSTSAIWIAENGVLLTPPAPPAIPSVSVAFVRAQAQSAALEIRVEPLTWERFDAADEAFLTNAFGGAVPIRGRGGELFARVARLFAEAWSVG